MNIYDKLLSTHDVEIPISIDELKKFVHEVINEIDSEIKKEFTEILKMYEIPEEQASIFEHMIKQYIKNVVKRHELPTEDWLIDALYKIFIHTTYLMNKAFNQCIFKTNLETVL